MEGFLDKIDQNLPMCLHGGIWMCRERTEHIEKRYQRSSQQIFRADTTYQH